jgi:hypothetical protein
MDVDSVTIGRETVVFGWRYIGLIRVRSLLSGLFGDDDKHDKLDLAS